MLKRVTKYAARAARRAGIGAGAAAYRWARGKGKKAKATRRKALKRRRYGGRKRAKRAADTSMDMQKEAARSALSIRLAAPKKAFRGLGRWSYLIQNKGVIQNQEGKQDSLDTVYHAHNSSQLLVSSLGGSQPLLYQWSDNPFDMNPFQSNTGGGVLTSVIKPLEDKVYMHSCVADLQFVNASDVPTQLDVYWLTPRAVTADGPRTTWANAMASRALGQSAAVNPTTAIGAMTTGYPDILVYGQEPKYESTFNQMYRTLRKRSIVLQGGAAHKFHYSIGFNRILDKRWLQQLSNANGNLIPNLSVVVFAVSRPYPVALQETSVTKGFTPGIAEIGFISNCRYTFQAMGASRLDVNRAEPAFFNEVPNGTTIVEKIISAVDSIIPNAQV